MQNWTAITTAYARAHDINFYHAQADVERRRRENGDEEAARWFARVSAGEALAWNERAGDEKEPCPTCAGTGRIPAGGWGELSGGWADVCPDCEAK